MKQRIIAVFTALVVLFSCSALSVQAYEAYDNIKVGLDFGTEAVSLFKAKTESNIVLGYATGRTFTALGTVDGSDVTVEKGGGTYLVTQYTYPSFAEALAGADVLNGQGYDAHCGIIDGAYKVLVGLYDNAEAAEAAKPLLEAMGIAFDVVYLDMKTVMVSAGYSKLVFRHDSDIFAFGSSSGATTRVNGKSYYGYILADRVHSNAIAIVNLVSFDDYLASVVGSEMYASWHIEALKAQAVIARTYAATVQSYKSYGVDVTDDTRTQAYNGTSSETASTRRAAQETSGIVVLYKGAPAQTFFTASSGGKTADVYSAWGGGAGLDYLKSVEDTYEDTQNIPNGVWSVSYTPAELKAKLAVRGVDIGDITDVYVAKRGDDERVHKLTFVGTKDTYSVTFDSCRTLLSLKSQFYYITPPVSDAQYVLTESGVQKTEGSMYVLSGAGLLQTGSSMYVLGKNGVVKVEKSDDAVYVFNGRGHGHGVGLSQYGAKGMAEAGFAFDEIINHYYPGTTLSE